MTGYLGMSAQRPETRLLAMISGVWMSRLVAFAVEEGVIATLARQPADAATLAGRLGFDPQVATRLLDGLVHLGLVQDRFGVYHLTEDGALLAPEAEGGFSAMSRLWSQLFDSAWGELAGTARTGRAGFELRHGMPIFAHIGQDPEIARVFDDAMRGLAGLVAREVAAALAPRRHPLICDVGGGSGLLLSRILAASPGTRGILFDRPDVAAAATVDDPRMTVIGGDFFEAVPPAPVHILSNVIHDWPDADALRILAAVAAAQQGDGILYLVEMMLGGAAEPLLARSTDLNMLMLTGGRERREAEFAEILGAAGYRISSVRPLAELTCLIEARKA
jgi:hypothetical protein